MQKKKKYSNRYRFKHATPEQRELYFKLYEAKISSLKKGDGRTFMQCDEEAFNESGIKPNLPE